MGIKGVVMDEDKRPTVCSIPDLAHVVLDNQISASSLFTWAGKNGLPGCRRIGQRYLVHIPTFMDWFLAGQGV